MRNQIELNSARIEFLRMRPFGDPNPNGENNLMKPTLYESVRKGDNVGAFIDAMERACTEMQLPLSAIIMHLSPAGNSLLHEAVAFGHKELTAIMASHFPLLLSMKNILGDTILHVAARKGSLPIVQLVIAAFEEHFPDSTACEDSLVRMKNEYGNTALHEAVINVKADVAKFLVNKDVETWYQKNDEGKSPIYLSIQCGDLDIVKILLEAPVSNVVQKLQGHSPVHAAIMEKRLDMLKEVLNRRRELFQLKDFRRRNPFHVAAYLGYIDGVDFLLSEPITKCFALEHDEDGQLPIHIACMVRTVSYHSTVKVMKKLLGQWPNPSELLDKHGRNILHIAAMNGRADIVNWILKSPQLGVLINHRDKDGNTAIHLATFRWYPFVLYYLVQDKRANVNLVNNQCSTALDFVEEQMLSFHQPIRKKLTRAALVRGAGARRSNDRIISKSWNLEGTREPPNRDVLKDRLNSRMIMATLVATMTFAAGFTNPGGEYNPDTATRMNRELFKVFVISNTIAMYSSVLAIVMFLWAQLGDDYAALWALESGKYPLYLSLIAMSLAFMAGTHVAMGKLSSLASTEFIMAIIFISFILMLFIKMGFPYMIMLPVLRQLSYISMIISIVISRSCLPPPKDLLLMENSQSVKESEKSGAS